MKRAAGTKLRPEAPARAVTFRTIVVVVTSKLVYRRLEVFQRLLRPDDLEAQTVRRVRKPIPVTPTARVGLDEIAP